MQYNAKGSKQFKLSVDSKDEQKYNINCMIVDSVIQLDPEIIWIACVENWEVNLSGAAFCCALIYVLY
jgi:hypothetical protein